MTDLPIPPHSSLCSSINSPRRTIHSLPPALFLSLLCGRRRVREGTERGDQKRGRCSTRTSSSRGRLLSARSGEIPPSLNSNYLSFLDSNRSIHSWFLSGGVVIVYERKVKLLYGSFEAVTLPEYVDMEPEQSMMVPDASVTTAAFQRMIQLAIVTKNYVGLTSEMRRRTSTSLLKKNLSLRLPLDPLCRTKMKLEASLICAEDVQRQQPVKRKARRKPSRRIMDDKHLMIPGNIYQLWLQDTSDILLEEVQGDIGSNTLDDSIEKLRANLENLDFQGFDDAFNIDHFVTPGSSGELDSFVCNASLF
ncbi:hypothetical protein BHE74_00035413 [Ensete ventricosum]|nr:hypothetical protein BHE74_00035413 [Ensete ventricosum]